MDYSTGTSSSINNMRPIFGAYAFQGESKNVTIYKHGILSTRAEVKTPMWLITMFPGTNKIGNNRQTSVSPSRNQYRLLQQ